jgi:hypothetical protein
MCKRPLYYMAPMGPLPIGNAAFIRLLGIFSYNQQKLNPVLVKFSSSIADPGVNYRRHWRRVGDRPLHDFVPFYWATHTPMQYVQSVRDKVIPQDDLVFYVVDADEILDMAGIWTTDGNAASHETAAYLGRGAEPVLDWKVLNTRDCYSPEYKRRKCAEVLVPDRVPPELIQRICVYSESAIAELDRRTGLFLHSLGVANISVIPVVIEVCRDLYY